MSVLPNYLYGSCFSGTGVKPEIMALPTLKLGGSHGYEASYKKTAYQPFYFVRVWRFRDGIGKAGRRGQKEHKYPGAAVHRCTTVSPGRSKVQRCRHGRTTRCELHCQEHITFELHH